MPLAPSFLPDAPPPTEAALDPLLASLLCCPVCADHPALRGAPSATESGNGAALLCISCGRTYPIKNGVPYFLVEDGGEKPKSGVA